MDGQGKAFSISRSWHPEIAPWLVSKPAHPGPEAVHSLIKSVFLGTASALLIRRENFLASGGFDLRLGGLADIDLYLRLLHGCDIAYLDEPLVCFRKHGSSATDDVQSDAKLVRFMLLLAYCSCGAYRRMQGDSRYSEATRQSVLRGLKSQVFDIFAIPDVVIPSDLAWAAKEIHEVTPDKRLLKTALSP